ncbi:hypothetical protein HZ326_9880 [Fusarium oxysporum f. sp. albedinis]|nr:hypothetical protein HZ326_9880 [Fusarium oxysporum f. sp. albedinis]
MTGWIELKGTIVAQGGTHVTSPEPWDEAPLRKCTSPRPRLPAYYSGTVGVPHQNRPCLTCASCHLSQSRLRTKEPRQSLYLPKSHPRLSRLNQRSEAPS